MVENHSGSSDMIQSTDAKVTVSTRKSRPGALTLRKRTLSAGVVPMPRSCSADQLLSSVDAQHPEGEVDDRADDEELRVQVGGLGLDDRVLRPPPGRAHSKIVGSRTAPAGRTARPAGSVARPGLEDAAADESPLAARQVLQHQQRQRAQRQPEAEEEADQPRAEELIEADRGADRRRRRGRSTPTMSAALLEAAPAPARR